MQENLARLRQVIAEIIAEQRCAEGQYSQIQAEILKWERRIDLAMSKGNSYLANEALKQKKNHEKMAATLKYQIDQLTAQLDSLKRSLRSLESGFSNNNSKPIETTLNLLEAKILPIDYRGQFYEELDLTGIERDFSAIPLDSEVDDELAMLKAEMSGVSLPGPSSTTTALPPSVP
jgi:phage shock protein A